VHRYLALPALLAWVLWDRADARRAPHRDSCIGQLFSKKT